MAVVIEERAAGGLIARGAARDFWKSREHEVVLAGPAETGKTWTACNKIDALLWKYPGAQGVMARKTYASLIGSAIQTYKRVIGFDSGHCPIKPYGSEKPEWFQYPNGSRLWIVGLDNPNKALSSERDFIYINQVEEITLEEWETLLTRCTGRGAVMPYTQMMGDANPGPPSHWILHRPSLKVLHSRHEDNPTLYDDRGVVTEQGQRSLAILDNLTGVRYQRLRLGKWVQAEGAVYETFERAVHVVNRQWLVKQGVFNQDGTLNKDKIKRVEGGQDWGWRNPGVLLVAAIDNDGRRYVIHEVYQSEKLIEWWCSKLVELIRTYGLSKVDCDPAEPAFIEAYKQAVSKAGLKCTITEAINDILPGIGSVQQALKLRGDGTYGLYFYEGMLESVDATLEQNKQPTGSLQEIDLYAWPKGADGKPVKEVPVDLFNHGMDALRYMHMQAAIGWGQDPNALAQLLKGR